MRKVSDKQIAMYIGFTPSALSYNKRVNPIKYEAYKLACIMDIMGLKESDLYLIASIRELNTDLRSK